MASVGGSTGSTSRATPIPKASAGRRRAPSAWRYRDYVIRSLNADKPYTKFLTEQIAGDEMSDDWKKAQSVVPAETIDRLAATGFMRSPEVSL